MIMEKVIVVIAAFNEEKNLPGVLEKISPDYAVIVVDDGSTDKTALVARNFGARVMPIACNIGQGAALVAGFRAALKGDWDVIVEIDGDGQHDPTEIPLFLNKFRESNADVIVGSRILGSNYKEAPFLRKTMLPLYTWFIGWISGYRITDAMCGFRSFRVQSIRQVDHILLDMIEPQYLAAELFLRFSSEGLKVLEVPIHLRKRSSGKSYKGLFRYGIGILIAIFKTILDKRRRKEARR